jgi:general secretion pathway protein G
MVESSTPRRSPRRAAPGFTLIEVLIVLVIVLAIGAIVAVNLMPRRDQALEDTERVQLRMIESALEQFYLDMGRYPTEEEGIAVLWDKTKLEDEALQDKHMGNYFAQGKKNLKDRWGNEYGYRPIDPELDGTGEESDGRKYELWSNGKDGEEGTADDIKLDESEDDESDTGGGI